MFIEILFSNCIDDLIESLLYFLPNKKYEIKLFSSNLNINDSVFIHNDEIYFDYDKEQSEYNIDAFYTDIRFNTIIDILKQCNDKTLIIDDLSLTEYNIIKRNYNFINYGFNNLYPYFIVINNDIHIVSYEIYSLFFKHLQIINFVNFMRNIKLKKLL